MAGDRTGRCACGAVTFTVTVEKDEIGACHCSLCRKMAAGPFLAVDVKDLEYADGAPVRRYESSEWAYRTSCAECGTLLAWHARDGSMTELAAFTLDQPPAGGLTSEIFVDEKPHHYAFAGDTVKLTGAEVMALAQGK